MKSFWKLGYLIIALLLLCVNGGCGGGASDSNGTLSVAVTAPTTAAPTGSVTAVYTNPQGKDPAGLEINFSTDRPDLVALDSTKGVCNGSGLASITFRAVTPATDTVVKITASTGGLIAFQQFTLSANVVGAPPPPPPVGAVANSVRFVSAIPTTISLKGFGTSTSPETSIVTFIVSDSANNPLSGQTVDFTLDTTAGGITLTPTSSKSDSGGRVQTIINSGNVATPVKVTAKVHGTTISAQSTQLVIAGGPPDQDSFSISLSNFNPEAMNINGKTVTVTAQLADHFNNPVADGTAVLFTTNGGSINSSCVTLGGRCSVTWTSQDPRPATPGTNPGTVAILAYAVGEESFTDTNNNGIADTGACSPVLLPGIGQAQQCGEFTDTPDAFRDDNFNGVRDSTEPFYNLTGSSTYSGPDGLYEGSFVVPASTNLRSKYIFYNSRLIMSGSTASTINLTPTVVPFNSTVPVTLTVTDINGNPMPSGTTITVVSTAASAVQALAFTPSSITVPNSTSSGAGSTVFALTVNNKFVFSSSTSENVQVTVTTPGGTVTTKSFIFTY